jgi:hypothetical protein
MAECFPLSRCLARDAWVLIRAMIMAMRTIIPQGLVA